MTDLPVNSEVADSLHCRLQSIQELTEFTESCQKQLDGFFEALEWSHELNANSIQEPVEMCPYDRNHRVPQKSMERHKVSCILNKMAYSQEEQAGMYDPTICYEKANVPSLVIDKSTQRQIILKAKASAPVGRTEGLYSQSEYSVEPPDVPQNHKRVVCDLTVADRLALLDHVTREAGRQRVQPKPAENDDLYVDLVAKLKKEEQNGPKSHLEVLAEMRDYKRRRQSYRAKNVHITKKSYTEVIREVINVHSGELARLWGDEEKEEEEEEEEKKEPVEAEEVQPRTPRHSSHRRRSEERRSVSVESRHSLGSSRDAHSSRRRRHRDRDRDRDRDDKRQRDSHTPDERRRERKKKRK